MSDHRMSPESYDHRLTYEQIAVLLSPIEEHRVGHVQGMSNMEAYEVRAEMNRIFGFANWSGEALRMELIAERWGKSRKDKTSDVVTVVYRCQYRLTVRSVSGEELASYTEWATGDALNQPDFKYGDAHDLAIKTAESQAFKRCAMNLGDQFGLSLYNKGSLDSLVNWTMAQKLPPEAPRVQISENRDAKVKLNPETDPDAGTATNDEDAVHEGDLLPPYAPSPANPQTQDQWKAAFNAARNAGPTSFVEFARWCFKHDAPLPVLDSLAPTLKKLNAMAEERGVDPVSFDFDAAWDFYRERHPEDV